MVPLFWNREERRLRALWRLLLQAVMMIALGVLPILLVAEPLTALHRRGMFLAGYGRETYDRIINMIVGPLLAMAVVASVVIAARWLDHRPLRDFGVGVGWRHLAGGFVLGGLLMLFVFATEWAAGWVEITGTLARNVADVPLSIAFAFTIVKVLCVGTYEELVMRGYHLRNIAEGTNLTIAVIVSSALFSVVHLFNDNASAVSTLGLFVNGLLFATAVLVTQRLSTAIGLHIAWNLFEGLVFGFPVSGDKEGASLIGIRQLGPDLITGGAFGPEAGMIGIIASLMGIAALLVMRRACVSLPAA